MRKGGPRRPAGPPSWSRGTRGGGGGGGGKQTRHFRREVENKLATFGGEHKIDEGLCPLPREVSAPGRSEAEVWGQSRPCARPPCRGLKTADGMN
eukprot:CAMPEP_0195090164 /NCGR_PEP_ID=MMETSP0448-20130528/29241_1 /TAXON_ID=66468 /ORGANISM="Heterocapsa triquestra, Strain CCMP 448" /LENGTH=94 /DNA_ID=CAMNT_0040123957 /DNA_START=42 /DNA_END=323 /DNA_ORIENTATION=+